MCAPLQHRGGRAMLEYTYICTDGRCLLGEFTRPSSCFGRRRAASCRPAKKGFQQGYWKQRTLQEGRKDHTRRTSNLRSRFLPRVPAQWNSCSRMTSRSALLPVYCTTFCNGAAMRLPQHRVAAIVVKAAAMCRLVSCFLAISSQSEGSAQGRQWCHIDAPHELTSMQASHHEQGRAEQDSKVHAEAVLPEAL